MYWERWIASSVAGILIAVVHRAGAARAAVITYLNPVVATLLGVLLLHERLGLGGFLAFVFTLLGSWLATRADAPAR